MHTNTNNHLYCRRIYLNSVDEVSVGINTRCNSERHKHTLTIRNDNIHYWLAFADTGNVCIKLLHDVACVFITTMCSETVLVILTTWLSAVPGQINNPIYPSIQWTVVAPRRLELEWCIYHHLALLHKTTCRPTQSSSDSRNLATNGYIGLSSRQILIAINRTVKELSITNKSQDYSCFCTGSWSRPSKQKIKHLYTICTEFQSYLDIFLLTYLYCALAAVQCIVIGPVCVWVCLCVGLLPR